MCLIWYDDGAYIILFTGDKIYSSNWLACKKVIDGYEINFSFNYHFLVEIKLQTEDVTWNCETWYKNILISSLSFY